MCQCRCRQIQPPTIRRMNFVNLPTEVTQIGKVDVLVSEPIGTFLFNERTSSSCAFGMFWCRGDGDHREVQIILCLD